MKKSETETRKTGTWPWQALEKTTTKGLSIEKIISYAGDMTGGITFWPWHEIHAVARGLKNYESGIPLTLEVLEKIEWNESMSLLDALHQGLVPGICRKRGHKVQ